MLQFHFTPCRAISICFMCKQYSSNYLLIFILLLVVVLLEIEDRRKFLAEMESLGQGAKYRTLINTEISQVRL